MARLTGAKSKEQNEEIPVSVFKDIPIHFPGDVYLAAVWVAMSNRAKSTPTGKPQTTLNGLAKKFSSLYGIDYSNPLDSDVNCFTKLLLPNFPLSRTAPKPFSL